MSATVGFPERAVAQATVVVKAYCNSMARAPLHVELVMGTSAENDAWRKVAVDYLTAKARGVKSIHEAIKLQD